MGATRRTWSSLLWTRGTASQRIANASESGYETAVYYIIIIIVIIIIIIIILYVILFWAGEALTQLEMADPVIEEPVVTDWRSNLVRGSNTWNSHRLAHTQVSVLCPAKVCIMC